MFDRDTDPIGLLPGESHERAQTEDDLAYELTCLETADGWVEPDRQMLPDDLESIAPGPYLAVLVGSVDRTRLNSHDVVRLMQAEARLESSLAAGKYASMAEVAFSPPSDPDSGVLRSSEEIEYAAVEIAAALTLSRRRSEHEVCAAVALSGCLRRVWHEFSQGRLDLAKVRVFDRFLRHLPADTIERVLDQILHEATDLTTGQLRARLDRLVLEVDPDGSRSSFDEGLRERRVTTGSNPDHTANLGIWSATPDQVVAARDHIERLARGLKTADESRSLDQLRTDVALDLLQGRRVEGRAGIGGCGRITITVSAETLAGLSDEPGEFAGYGPVFAEMARKAAIENTDGEWSFVVTDNGRPLATGTLARRPTAAQKRWLVAHSPTCSWPGCRQDGWDCDIDHRTQRQHGGHTCIHNLEPLCRFHHIIKDTTRWNVEPLENGDHLWTSPLGHTYTRKRDPPN